MKYIDADSLRKEVKRLEKAAHKSALGCADSETRKLHEGKDFAYQHVSILIDSLQQEQPSDDLEEAADNYIRKVADTAGHPGWDWTTQDIADAFKAGAEWQKEQMLKDAVEGEVVKDINNKLAVTAKNVNLDGFRFGDKVRIIILPKEDGE